MGDGLLALSGTGIAAAAAALPFFVAAHPDSFGPPELRYEPLVIDLASAETIREEAGTDLKQRAILATPYDDVSVGSVFPSSEAKATFRKNEPISPYSPFQTSNAFGDWQRDRVTSTRRAIAFHNGRAAVVDGGTVRMVRKGSILADGRHVSSVRGRRDEVLLLFEDGSLETLPISRYPIGQSAQATRK
ncbi:hypothetical protein [Notoacmeibacter ruber]|uniref:Uncharacterized protein n=1 Tax=Notoacmeibacter ruber TaxID=2670375 RepID=A0A3L7JES9_9HYPH|nr:hypothetical protein [Notoacmeibacter ruber]RLQ88819.1 hypothetical protein D8780_11925 [Notoacmeibacter ruber]